MIISYALRPVGKRRGMSGPWLWMAYLMPVSAHFFEAYWQSSRFSTRVLPSILNGTATTTSTPMRFANSKAQSHWSSVLM